MRRFRLFEFEDQAWLPAPFRNYLTETLRYQVTKYGTYAPAVGKIRDAVLRAGCDQIVDLCSGAGGPQLQIREALKNEHGLRISVVMTDRFPNTKLIEQLRHARIEGVTYLTDPIDAASVPADLKGLRTLFTSFHHLGPGSALALLQKAVEDRAPIAVFEFTERKFLNLIGALLSPVALLFQTPWITPFSWGRLLWTYLLPVIPMMNMWDCAVSHLRSYTLVELQRLALEAGMDRYNWQAGTIISERTRGSITYLIGYPAMDEEQVSAFMVLEERR
jgi:hypothetical protein